MKIAVVNTFDVKDIKNWSGIPFHLSVFLEQFFGKDQVDFIAIPLKRGIRSYLKGFYYNRVKHRNYLSDFDGDILASNYDAFKDVREKGYDVILTFQFFIIPNLKNACSKIIFWSDATFQNLLNYYQYVSNLPPSSISNIHAIQRNALEISDSVIFSSQWAVSSATGYYSADPQKFTIIPFASNLNKVPAPAEIKEIIDKRNTNAVKLLFLGIDWERKGGDDAVKVLNNLNEMGIKTILYAVGVDVPPAYTDNPNIIATGFINKNEEEGEVRIIELLKESSFLILPTKADCTPVVFSEANSYGLPVITTTVGGITSVIEADVNGCCFNEDDFVAGATAFILKYYADSEAYRQLCFNSYRYYNEALSWHNLEEKFKTVLTGIDINRNH